MKRKIMAPVLAAALLLSNGITAFAAPEVIPIDENSYILGASYVFDYEYYASVNPDVAAALGTDRETLLQHYRAFGMAEHRASFDMDTLIALSSIPARANKKLPVRIENYTLKDGKITYGNRTYFYYRCDDQGNVLSETVIYENRNGIYIGGSTSYTYDRQGKLLSEATADSVGNPIICTYDGQGNILSKVQYFWEYKHTYTYTYDEQGKLLSETKVVAVGDYVFYTDTYTYTYDEQGNTLLKTETISNGNTYTTAYAYDAMGNILSEATTNSDGSIDTKAYTYDYDAMGNILSEATTNSDGSIYTKAYTYDAMGNTLSERHDYYDDNNTYTSDITEYFYE